MGEKWNEKRERVRPTEGRYAKSLNLSRSNRVYWYSHVNTNRRLMINATELKCLSSYPELFTRPVVSDEPPRGKPTIWCPNRSDTNRTVQAQKNARDWKFSI